MVKALEELPGIKKANASFQEKRAIVIYDRALVTVEQMNKALLKVGCVVPLKENYEEDIVTQFNESIYKSYHQNTGLICYCFEYTTHDIEQDFIKNGQSLIMAKIAAEKKANGCDCKNKNPKGK